MRFNDGSTTPKGLYLSVPVGTNGRFTLILPAPPQELRAGLTPSDPACPLTAGTPSSLRLYFVMNALQVEVQGVSSQLLELPEDKVIPANGYPSEAVSRAYTDAPGSAHFTINCSGYITTFDLDLHAGWNRMVVQFDPATSAVTYCSVPAALTTKLVIFRPPTVPIPSAPTPAPAPSSHSVHR